MTEFTEDSFFFFCSVCCICFCVAICVLWKCELPFCCFSIPNGTTTILRKSLISSSFGGLPSRCLNSSTMILLALIEYAVNSLISASEGKFTQIHLWPFQYHYVQSSSFHYSSYIRQPSEKDLICSLLGAFEANRISYHHMKQWSVSLNFIPNSDS